MLPEEFLRLRWLIEFRNYADRTMRPQNALDYLELVPQVHNSVEFLVGAAGFEPATPAV